MTSSCTCCTATFNGEEETDIVYYGGGRIALKTRELPGSHWNANFSCVATASASGDHGIVVSCMPAWRNK